MSDENENTPAESPAAEHAAETAVVRLDSLGRPLRGIAANPALRGKGPPKGSGGRPRNEWKQALANMASSDEVLYHVRCALEAGPEHPFFAKALEYATDHGMGKATQSIEHSGSIGLTDLLARSHDTGHDVE